MNTTEIINYIYDVQFEYNIKLYLLIMFASFSLFSLWYFNKYEPEMLWQYYLKHIAVVISKVYVFLGLPTWVFFLSRNVTLDAIIRPLMFIYGIGSLLFMVFVILFGAEKIKMFFSGEGFYRNRK